MTPVEPAPVVEPDTCDHLTGTPGCDLPDCNGVPTADAIEAADADRSTPSDTPTPGEYGVDGAIRTLRAQVVRALDGAEVTMPTRTASHAQAWGRPGRPFAVFTMSAAGRTVTVVEYPSRGPLNPHRTDVYAVFVDGEMITGECRPVQTGWDWTAFAIGRLISDHVERTATDADRARRDRALIRAHATTWAIGQGMPSDGAVAFGEWFMVNGDPDADHAAQIDRFATDRNGADVEPAPVDRAEYRGHAYTWALSRWGLTDVADAYADWFVINGDPDADHAAHVSDFHRAHPDMIDSDGWPVVDVEPADVPADVVEPAPVADPVATVEPAPVELCDADTETDSGPYPCRTVRPCREHEGPSADVEPAHVDPVEPAPVAAPVVAVAAPVEPAPLPTFTVARTTLADALAYVVKGVPTRPSVPILSGVEIDADADGVTVSTFDYETHRAYRADTVDVVEPGRAVVSCRLLADMIKALPKGADRVTIGRAGSTMTVSAGTRAYTLPTMPAEDYPATPDAAPTVGTVDMSMFGNAIARVAVAAGRDDTLPVLTGLHVSATPSALTLTASDRYRLTLADVPWSPTDGAALGTVLPHARTLADAVKVFTGAAGKAGGTLTVGMIPTHAGDPKDWRPGALSLAYGPFRLTVRLLEGEFPKVRALLPDGYGARATVKASAVVATVKGVAVVAERATPVRLTVDPGTVEIAAGGSEDATARDQLPCTIDTGTFVRDGERLTLAPGFTVAFNHAYLLDGVKAVGTDRLTLSVTTPRKPVVLDPVGGDPVSFRYLIMPVRIGGDGPDTDGTPVADADVVEPATDTDTDAPTAADPAADGDPVELDTPTADPVADATDGDPVEPAADDTKGTPAMPDTAIDHAVAVLSATDYDTAAKEAHALLTAGDPVAALARVADVPAGHLVNGKHAIERIRARIMRDIPAAPVADVEPADVEPADTDTDTVAPVEPAGNGSTVVARTTYGRPVIVAHTTHVDVEPATVEPATVATVTPVDAVALATAESAVSATVTGEPTPAVTVALSVPDGPLVYTLPRGFPYRVERKRVRQALHAARFAGRLNVPGIDRATAAALAVTLADVVAHVEGVKGIGRQFLVTYTAPDGADTAAVRAAIHTVVTAATVTVVDTVDTVEPAAD